MKNKLLSGIVFCILCGINNTLSAQTPLKQMAPPPTAKEVATMDAALKYNQDLKSTLWPAHDPVMIKQDSVYYLFTAK